MRLDGTIFNKNDATHEVNSTIVTAHHESNGEVLDVWALCDRCMGNLDLVERVLDKFETRLPDELAELERVLEQDDAAKIALVAHRIKGNSSNVSAIGLRHAAAEIEDLSRAGRVADARVELSGLRSEWKRYMESRDEVRASIAGSASAGACGGRRVISSGGKA
jgi:HPt (histidine-containing phosphotransfer) domain-containing protein